MLPEGYGVAATTPWSMYVYCNADGEKYEPTNETEPLKDAQWLSTKKGQRDWKKERIPGSVCYRHPLARMLRGVPVQEVLAESTHTAITRRFVRWVQTQRLILV
jgi:hypothetical protein